MTKNLLDAVAIEKTLLRLAHEIAEKHKDISELAIVGIKTRGVHIAGRVAENIKKISGKKVYFGKLGITLYRDDLSQVASQPVMQSTEIDFNVEGKVIILADDVLYTGRTVRCALDALIDLGRPAKIELLVLVDRGHRELPIRADYAGKNIPTSKDEIVHVHLREEDGEDEIILERRTK